MIKQIEKNNNNAGNGLVVNAGKRFNVDMSISVSQLYNIAKASSNVLSNLDSGGLVYGDVTGLPTQDKLLNWDSINSILYATKINCETLESTVVTGTAPFTVASTTLVDNLNAQYWDGYEFGDYLDQPVKTTSDVTFNELSLTDNLNLLDNKSVMFGTGGDMSISYDGAHMYFESLTSGEYIFDNRVNIFTNSDGPLRIASSDSFCSMNLIDPDGSFYFGTGSGRGFYGPTNAIHSNNLISYNNNIGIGEVTPTEKCVVNGNMSHSDDNQYNYFGLVNDAGITYDATNMVLVPDIVGSGGVIISASNANALTIGNGTAGIDYILKFDGETNDGTVTYLEDDDIFSLSSFVRKSSADYRRYYHLPIASFSPGLSGATWTPPTANNLCGWQLNASGEVVEFSVDVHSDWDGVSDLGLDVYFQLLAAGSADDTVDIKIVFYYIGQGESATKTQTVEVATITDGTQYKTYKAVFVVDHDAGGAIVEAGDKICGELNLETDTSEIDDILIIAASFYYNTTHIGIESGDV